MPGLNYQGISVNDSGADIFRRLRTLILMRNFHVTRGSEVVLIKQEKKFDRPGVSGMFFFLLFYRLKKKRMLFDGHVIFTDAACREGYVTVT